MIWWALSRHNHGCSKIVFHNHFVYYACTVCDKQVSGLIAMLTENQFFHVTGSNCCHGIVISLL